MKLIALLVLVMVAGCADDGSENTNVTATKVDGVWVFSGPTPSDAKGARFSGAPRIVGDCLMVGSGVVVWRSSDLRNVTSVVAEAKAESDIEVGVGGDLLRDWESKSSSRPPEMRVPAVIAEKCSIDDDTVVWEAATGPLL
jgi:hypothetical protein